MDEYNEALKKLVEAIDKVAVSQAFAMQKLVEAGQGLSNFISDFNFYARKSSKRENQVRQEINDKTKN